MTLGVPFGESHGSYRLSMAFTADWSWEAGGGTVRHVVEAIGRASGRREGPRCSACPACSSSTAASPPGACWRRARADAPLVQLGDSGQWWQESTVSGISAPIGQKGARDVAMLTFDSSIDPARCSSVAPARVSRRCCTTLHRRLTTIYGPDELELYLIDFKEGVEFKAYAEAGLPHARVVAIESDREFGLSVLQSLEAELDPAR